MENAARRNLLPGVALTAALLLLSATFASAAFLPFVIRVGLNILGLVLLAAALFLTIGATLQAPSPRRALKGTGVALLVLGVVAVLLMTPFAAMALAVLAQP